MSKRERIIEIVQRISNARAVLKRLEDEFAELVPDDEEAPQTNATELSMPDKVIMLLDQNQERTFDAQEAAKAISTTDIHLMRSTLFRLAKRGRIRKTKRGQYGSIHGGKKEVAA